MQYLEPVKQQSGLKNCLRGSWFFLFLNYDTVGYIRLLIPNYCKIRLENQTPELEKYKKSNGENRNLVSHFVRDLRAVKIDICFFLVWVLSLKN